MQAVDAAFLLVKSPPAERRKVLRPKETYPLSGCNHQRFPKNPDIGA